MILQKLFPLVLCVLCVCVWHGFTTGDRQIPQVGSYRAGFIAPTFSVLHCSVEFSSSSQLGLRKFLLMLCKISVMQRKIYVMQKWGAENCIIRASDDQKNILTRNHSGAKITAFVDIRSMVSK